MAIKPLHNPIQETMAFCPYSASGATVLRLLPELEEGSGSPYSQRAILNHIYLSGLNAPSGSSLSGCQLLIAASILHMLLETAQ